LYSFVQPIASGRPILDSSDPAGRPAVVFDGSDDYMTHVAARLSGPAGAAFFVAKQNTAGEDTVFATADVSTANQFMSFGINSGKLQYEQVNGGTEDDLTGDTPAGTGWHLFEITTDGSTTELRVDGRVEEITINSGANNGEWAGAVAGLDNMTIGAMVASTVSAYADVSLAELVAYDSAQSDVTRALVRKKLAAKYKIAIA